MKAAQSFILGVRKLSRQCRSKFPRLIKRCSLEALLEQRLIQRCSSDASLEQRWIKRVTFQGVDELISPESCFLRTPTTPHPTNPHHTTPHHTTPHQTTSHKTRPQSPAHHAPHRKACRNRGLFETARLKKSAYFWELGPPLQTNGGFFEATLVLAPPRSPKPQC